MKNSISIVFLILLLNLTLSSANEKSENKLKIGIKKRVSGKKILILKIYNVNNYFQAENCEQKSRKGDLLHVHYKGTLTDGTVFDSSEGRNPLTFTLGKQQVIQGWEKGLLGMCVKEVRKLIIPPELGYGSSAVGKIPKDSVLIFEVELIKIENKNEEL